MKTTNYHSPARIAIWGEVMRRPTSEEQHREADQRREGQERRRGGHAAGDEKDHPTRSGSGMNSCSPGTMVKRPALHCAFASSMRSLREETKFHQT